MSIIIRMKNGVKLKKLGAGAEPVNWKLVCGFQDGIGDSIGYAVPEIPLTVQPAKFFAVLT
jgi:hypothetical protein